MPSTFEKRIMKTLITITLAFSLLLLSACTDSPEKQIIGKWKEIEKPASKVEFYDDGTLVVYNESNPIILNGTWAFLEDGRLKTEMSMMGIQSVETVTVTFEGDNMTTVGDKQKVYHLTRDRNP